MRIAFFLLICHIIIGQDFTLKDSLIGSLRPERTCFDVQHYYLEVVVDLEKKHLKGSNIISFDVVENTQKIQLDLFENMQVDSIVWHQQKLKYERIHGAVFIEFPETLPKKTSHKVKFYYQGHPLVAKNAPWDGGFVWAKDANNLPFVGVAVQGTGASLWYPVKDHQTDEPNQGADVLITVPKELVAVSNGNLIATEESATENQLTTWHWQVTHPINTYNITLNIGNYELIKDQHNDLKMEYWVLKQNKAKAIKHFAEVHDMMACFESKFGKYPFSEDGYKLVETPYLGMEHQSAIAYGNQYKKGYLGRDFTGTKVGMAFDYIVIHETAHEWFGNSITSKDIADMWIHEGFTTYAETVFVECTQGYQNAQKYINGQKNFIQNKKPMIGVFGVNHKMKSSDHYYKGALMLNTLSHTFQNREDWWRLLKSYTENFKHQIIESKDVVAYFQEHTDWNCLPFFEQYLNQTQVPTLEITKKANGFELKFTNVVNDFEMPLMLNINNQAKRIIAHTKAIFIPAISIDINENEYYIKVKLNN